LKWNLKFLHVQVPCFLVYGTVLWMQTLVA
jgi:hypothetical protein